MEDFLKAAIARIPTLAGVKFSSVDMFDLGRCLVLDKERIQILYGGDEVSHKIRLPFSSFLVIVKPILLANICWISMFNVEKRPNVVGQHLVNGNIGHAGKRSNIVGQRLLNGIVGRRKNVPTLLSNICWTRSWVKHDWLLLGLSC